MKKPETRKFDLNIEKILEDWAVQDALREIIANAMDEGLLTCDERLDIFKDREGKWHVRDYGRGLNYEHLTQKENAEKLKSPYVIGKFGIGLKDALATFDRKKVKVLIRSKFGDITLGKAVKHDFEDLTTLHAYIDAPSDAKFEGTEFVLENCKDEDMDKAKDLFLRFSGESVLEETPYGSVLAKKSKAGRIYINGVKCAEEENFLFSYNITSLTKEIRKALNRERTNVGRTAYTNRVKSILLSCDDKAIAKALVDDLKGFETGLLHDEMNWGDISVYACKLLNSLESVVFVTPQELVSAVELVDRAKLDGYDIVTIPLIIKIKIEGQLDVSGKPMRVLDQYLVEWNKSLSFKFINEKDLSEKERQVFGHTKKILSFIGGKPKGVKEIKISETMRIESNSFNEATGLWEPAEGRIIIKRDQLKSLVIYAGTLIHEAAHASSGAPDVNRDFEQKLTAYLGLITSKSLNS